MTNFNVIGGPNAAAYPIVHRNGPADLKEALAKGIADFWAIPSSIIFLCLVFPLFPIIGIIFANGVRNGWLLRGDRLVRGEPTTGTRPVRRQRL